MLNPRAPGFPTCHLLVISHLLLRQLLGGRPVSPISGCSLIHINYLPLQHQRLGSHFLFDSVKSSYHGFWTLLHELLNNLSMCALISTSFTSLLAAHSITSHSKKKTGHSQKYELEAKASVYLSTPTWKP